MKKYAPHEQRVIDEMIQLDEKIHLLHAFIKTSEIYKALPVAEQDLLVQQRVAMRAYSAVLNQRIALFTPVEVEEGEQVETPDVPLTPLFRAKLKVLQVIPDERYETVVMASEDNPAAELTLAISDPQLIGAISPLDVFSVDFTLTLPETGETQEEA